MLPWLVLICLFHQLNPGQETQPAQDGSAMLQRDNRYRTQGDLDEIRRNRVLRVLVTHNKTNFFITGDQPRGFEYEMLKQYEKFLNKGLSRRGLHTTVVFVPVSGEELLPALLEGRGDMAAASLTITPEREAQVTFTRPYLTGVREIVVGNRGHTPVKRLADLAGRSVYVREGSSYAHHLRVLNDDFSRRGLPPVDILLVERLETEDILEMVNAGIEQLTVVDDYLARFWASAMDNLVLFPEVAVHEGGSIAWAVPRHKPKLLDHLNLFIAKNRKGTTIGNILFKRYYQNIRWVTDPFARVDRAKIGTYIALFKKYGRRYGFDWLAVAALSYQESMFDHALISSAGAIGLMQITEATAADKNVAIANIGEVENNIHAGVRYLNWIRNRYFQDPGITPDARIDFTLAAYNAGPAKVNRMRRKAEEMGYDPNRWFHHVEWAALRYIGQETVRYVANINKYYILFKLSLENLERRRNLKGTLIDKR